MKVLKPFFDELSCSEVGWSFYNVNGFLLLDSISLKYCVTDGAPWLAP